MENDPLKNTNPPLNNLQQKAVTTLPKKYLVLIIGLLVIIFTSAAYFSVNKVLLQKKDNQSNSTNNLSITPVSSIKTTQGPIDLSKLPEEILASKLYYQQDSIVYERAPLNSDPKIFLNADSYEFSPDLTKVAYFKEYGPGSDLNFYILDLKTKQTQTFKTESESKRWLEWSPDGKYILVNSGTGPSGATEVYEVATGTKIGTFDQMGGLIWIDNENFYKDELEDTQYMRPWEGGEGSSIVKMNLKANAVTSILKTDDINDYRPLSIKGSCLYYVQTSVTTPEGWNIGEFIETEKCLDLQTGQSRVATKGETKDKDEELINTMMNLLKLDSENGDFLYVIDNEKIANWKIAYAYSDGSIYNANLYIVNEQNPAGTLTFIGQGASIVWTK